VKYFALFSLSIILFLSSCSLISSPKPTPSPPAGWNNWAEYEAEYLAAYNTGVTNTTVRISKEEYLDYVVAANEALLNIFSVMQVLYSVPVLDDAEWVSAMSGLNGVIQEIYQETNGILPPPKFRPSFEKLKEAFKHYNNSAVYMDKAITNLDQGFIDLSSAEIEIGNAVLGESAALLTTEKQ
jgi:hypothetical protein